MQFLEKNILEKQEKLHLIRSLYVTLLFVALYSVIFVIQSYFDINFTKWGIYPRKLEGLIGIITGPLIHADFKHYFNNTIPILILGTALFYFYKEIALKVFLWSYLMVGIWVWSAAREAYHIGASGILYALFAFLLLSGFIRKNTHLIALSFFVAFIYGSMIWGIFPIDLSVSFEGHFFGFFAGLILAIYFRKQGAQKKKYEWEDEDDDTDENPYWKTQDGNASNIEINYTIVKGKENKNQ